MMDKLLLPIFVLMLVNTISCSQSSSKQCEEKEKSLALLEIAKDSITKAKGLVPECEENNTTTSANKSACGKKEKVGAFIDVALELISEAKDNYPECDGRDPDDKPDDKPFHADCLEIMQKGETRSGVYTIQPKSQDASKSLSFDVYCDMDTDGGGWTVIQRRGKFTPQEDFYRVWNDYKSGFGNITRDFWLGNDRISVLSNQGNSSLRADMQSEKGKTAYTVYGTFRVENEKRMYFLHIGNYSGNAGDGFLESSNGIMFSTKDRRNDQWQSTESCTDYATGGWWYKDCGHCNPNGLYQPGVRSPKSVHWSDWIGNLENLESIELKIRKNGPL